MRARRLGARWVRGVPRRRMARQRRLKWVRGRSSPSHWAGTGIDSKGNMKPERSTEGRKKKKADLGRLELGRTREEMTRPKVRLAAMKRSEAIARSRSEPSTGTRKSATPETSTRTICTMPMAT